MGRSKTPALLEICIGAALLLLPLFFDPFARYPLERGKVDLFRAIAVGMMLASAVYSLRSLDAVRSQSTTLARTSMRRLACLLQQPLAGPLILYCGIYGLSTATSIDPHISLWGTGDGHGTISLVLVIAFSLLAAARLRTWRQYDRVVTWLIVGSVAVALYGWAQYLGLDAMDWTTNQVSPVHSTFARNILLGGYLAMVIPFTLLRSVKYGAGFPHMSWSYIFVLALQFTCLFLSLARGAWLALLGSCLLLLGLFLYDKGIHRLAVFASILLIGGSLLFLLIASWGWVLLQYSPQPVSEGQFFLERSLSNMSRLVLWQQSAELAWERLPIGYGPETFGLAYLRQFGTNRLPYQFWQIVVSDPHNLFLSHLNALGIAGLLALVWILKRFYSQTLRAFRHTLAWDDKAVVAGIMSAVTSYLVQAQFNSDSIVTLLLFWFFVAAADRALQRSCELQLSQ